MILSSLDVHISLYRRLFQIYWQAKESQLVNEQQVDAVYLKIKLYLIA
jgi:hypothetical protein